MSKVIFVLSLSLIIGMMIVFTFMVVSASEMNMSDTEIDINGLFWGDSDYLKYNLRSEAIGKRGYLYYTKRSDTTVDVLVRVDPYVNDNAFEPIKTSYIADIGLSEGYDLGWNPGHDLNTLVGSEHLEIFMRCGTGNDAWTYSWIQDYVYDANQDPPNYDWRSDQFGPDGSPEISNDPAGHPVPEEGIVLESHSSLEYNLENSSWFLVNETGVSNNYNNWQSPDLSPIGTISVTVPITDVNAVSGSHEDYPFFVQTGVEGTDLFEWAMIYEMTLDFSVCGSQPIYIGVPSAHNSPAKSGSEDVEIPTGEPIQTVVNYLPVVISIDLSDE